MQEQAKYEKAWANDAYRVMSPGANIVQTFLEVADPDHGATVRDLGCGTGRAGKALAEAGLKVTQYDFVENCRDAGIDLPFVHHDLNQPIPGPPADFAFCTDVMEHLPRDEVLRALLNVVTAGRHVFLLISTVDDRMHWITGEPLHLTVEPMEWWKERLEGLDCKILWSQEYDTHCAFYVRAFADAKEWGPATKVNVSDEMVKENVLANLKAGYREVIPHLPREDALMILAGGPSLLDHKDEIIARRKAGEYLVTVNNTHQLCREWGIEPSLHIMCDGRAFNARFVENPFPRTTYLIASQCHPDVLAKLPHEQVMMWHSGTHLADVIEQFDRGEGREPRTWYPIMGGGTVMLRALPLLHCLGFHKFECFGFDGCLMDDAHHAYEQKENDGKAVVTTWVKGREFKCHPWMVSQAGDFVRMQAALAPHIDLIVHGDGLIAHIINTAAEDD